MSSRWDAIFDRCRVDKIVQSIFEQGILYAGTAFRNSRRGRYWVGQSHTLNDSGDDDCKAPIKPSTLIEGVSVTKTLCWSTAGRYQCLSRAGSRRECLCWQQRDILYISYADACFKTDHAWHWKLNRRHFRKKAWEKCISYSDNRILEWFQAQRKGPILDFSKNLYFMRRLYIKRLIKNFHETCHSGITNP